MPSVGFLKEVSIMNKICCGCGISMQFDDKNAEGYVPVDKYEGVKYCQSCYQLMHYGKYDSAEKPKENEEILDVVNRNADYVLFVCDFISLTPEIMGLFEKITVFKTLVMNKCDIIPKNISFRQIENYIRKNYGQTFDILFTNKKSKHNNIIKKLYDYRNIYIVGLTNMGKSTLLNSIMTNCDASFVPIATSYHQNTTRDFIEVKIGNQKFVDAPGFFKKTIDNSHNSLIDREIIPIIYQNKVVSSYTIDKLFTFEVEGISSLVFYFSRNIAIKRKFKSGLQGNAILIPQNSDIVIYGLGFIKVTSEVKMVLPPDIEEYIAIRPSITGGR